MSDRPTSRLLALDSIINVVLGLVLLVVPSRAIAVLGLPETDTFFYVTVLGAILVGIGLALWIERGRTPRWRGLGMAGAIAINLLGAGAVAAWLIVGPLDLPLRGHIVLWAVVAIVLATAVGEMAALLRPQS